MAARLCLTRNKKMAIRKWDISAQGGISGISYGDAKHV